MPTSTYYLAVHEAPLPAMPRSGQDDRSDGFARKYVLDWAVRDNAVSALALTQLSDGVPVHHGLMLDAVLAASEGDFRRCLLYSAMAIETLANAKLDQTYDGIIAGSDTPGQLRVSTFATPQGSGRKDPIYLFLKGRGRFPQLLHEQCLYLLGRSLLLSDQKLYADAQRVYATRNKIAHQGLPPDDVKYFPIDKSGARSAMQCARGVFAWFGEDGSYPDPLEMRLVDRDGREL